ncbi:MAG: hypothetical protein R6W31_05165 [Bacteroidales bacterium]
MRTISFISLLMFMGLMSACMKDKPEALPENLVWNPELALPLGSDRLGLNAESGFDTTLFEFADMIDSIPKWVEETVTVLERTLDFDLSLVYDHIDSIHQVLFRVGIFNGFPNEISAQAYFMDALNHPIDSMFSEGPLPVPAGIPIGNGETIHPTLVRKDALFVAERIAPLEYATKILLRAVIAHPQIDTLLVPFYPYYSIEMEIGMMTDLTIAF